VNFQASPEAGLLLAEARAVLSSPAGERLVATLAARRDRDPRPLFRLLGERALLAPHWPPDLGGRGCRLTDAAAVFEELGRLGVPDALHVISIQTVGGLLLLTGTPEQRQRYLPLMARGGSYAAVLFTERAAGSDLSAVETTARADGDGFVLSGTKTFSLVTGLTDHGLCLARTSPGSSRYDGLTLFMVPLDRPGVRVAAMESIADDRFHEVELDDVRLCLDAVVGRPGSAWPLLMRGLSLERTGLDCCARARHWLDLTWRAAGRGCDPGVLAGLARLEAHLDAARLLTYRVLTRMDAGAAPEDHVAAAKWYSGELAFAVAAAGPVLLGQSALADAGLEAAYREAAGLRIAGGTAEIMLETFAAMRLAGADQGGEL
jgi:alkylation response protein AidB-like acyl-CoA dehydrogenase